MKKKTKQKKQLQQRDKNYKELFKSNHTKVAFAGETHEDLNWEQNERREKRNQKISYLLVL